MELYDANYKQLTSEDWAWAACREAPGINLFYPVGETGADNLAQITDAKKYCRRCPLIAACLELALDKKEQGIWGGTTDRERNNLRKQRDRRVGRRVVPIVYSTAQRKKAS